MSSGETILCEFPPNPNLVNYHTRRQLTTMMSERYTPTSEYYPEDWIRALAEIAAITNIHIMRHKLRIKRDPDCDWKDIMGAIESTLYNYWHPIEIQRVSNDIEARRTFDLPGELFFESREVYEGVSHAQNSGLATALYEIYGITTVIFFKDEVTIKRGYCYPWEEILPKIIKVLAEC